MERLDISRREAAEAWVRTFVTIPTVLLERLTIYDADEMREVTPPCAGDRVQITGGPHTGHSGEVLSREPGSVDEYMVRIDDMPDTAIISKRDIKALRTSELPAWSVMWAFRRPSDIDWLDGLIDPDALYKTASCGFRIYAQDDFGFIIGIDSEGCDFFEAHWIPLYNARGLHWHDE